MFHAPGAPPAPLPPNAHVPNSFQWRHLENSADQLVMSSLHQLADPPSHYQKPVISTLYRLYKLIAPVSKPTDADQNRLFVSLDTL